MFGFALGPSQVIILVLVGVVLFGRRLPDIGRQLAQSLRAFQEGWRGIENDIGNVAMTPEASLSAPRPPQRVSAAVPRFETNGDAKAV